MPVILNVTAGNMSLPYIYNRSYIYTISAIAALGGLLFGFDLVIISGTIPFFKVFFKLDELSTGWAVGCINLGAAIGAMIAGKLSDKLGRRKALMCSALLFAITGIGTGWATSFNIFILARTLSGVALGAAALVCPMYIAEISPSPMRGRMVSFYQLSIVMGIMLAYILNYLLLNTGVNNWRWMFSSQSLPSLLFFAGLLFVAESPRWLIGKNRLATALTVLTKIGGEEYAQKEARQITDSYRHEIRGDVKALFKKNIWPIIFMGIMIAACSQAVGQNSLFSYAPILFRQAGMSQDTAFLQSIIIGIITIAFTFVAIGRIDKTGRKKLLLWGAVLLCLDAFALAGSFYWQLPGMYVLVFLLVFIAIYSATIGPVTWVALSEIFPNRVRANAMGLATLVLWITNFFTTASFPVMKQYLGLPATFVIHGIICLAYAVYVFIRIPETRNRSLEEIEAMLINPL
jgi:SP family arabinose:H+ symporter-like MFS transporter